MFSTSSETDLLGALESVFGYSQFRPHQEEAISAALAGRDCLVVMPTGAGKSLTFQLPAAISEGVTVVISPLIALMRDQVLALREKTAFDTLGAAFLNSSQTSEEQRDILTLVRANRIKLLYIAPERLRSPAFIETLKAAKIARLVVDEAHCISEWGHDFRPDYLAIKDVLNQLERVPRFAVTATATVRVQKSIAENLGMREPEVIVGGFNRPNLHFSVVRCKNDLERDNKLFRALPKLAARGGSGLIYVSTRKHCESVSELASKALAPLGVRAGCYHAGMESNTRSQMQEAWLRGEIPVLVATNAFGMGIDKGDVRFVIHYGYPESPESYYQEAGRAGRDGRKSRVTILTSSLADKKLRDFFITNEAISSSDLKEALDALSRYGGEETFRVPRHWWDMEFGWREPKPRVVLGKLEQLGALQRLSDNLEGSLLRIVKSKLTDFEWRKVQSVLDRDQNERFKRLDEMVYYTKCRGCRRRVLLDYFGDDDEHDPAFCCDNCDAGDSVAPQPPAQNLAQGRVPAPTQIGDIYDLLQALDSLYPSVGKTRLGKILRGSKASDAQNYASHVVFGACKSVNVMALSQFLDLLIERGLLHQGDEDEFFVVRVTRAGREAWESRSGLDEIRLPGSSKREFEAPDIKVLRAYDEESLSPEEEAIFQKLRVWRRGQSDSENLKPFMVFGDKVLREIARQAPGNLDELAQISGVGGVKLEKYGAMVLGVLAEK